MRSQQEQTFSFIIALNSVKGKTSIKGNEKLRYKIQEV